MSLLAGRWSNENQRETERERDLQAGVKHVNSVNKNKPPISRRNLAGRTDKAEQKSGHLSMVGMLTSSWPQSIHIGLFWLNTVVMQIHYQSTILFSHNSDGYYTKGLGILKLAIMSNIFEIIWKLVYWPVHYNQHDQKPSYFEVSGAKKR